jgi:hypothetical protein
MRCRQPGPVHIAAAALCCWPLASFASPFEVPDVDPEEYLELKTTLERESSGDQREWDAPQFELTFPLAEDLELSLETGYAIVEEDGESHSGLSDSEVSAKWRFYDRGTTLTLQPAFTFDTGHANDEGDAFSLGLLAAHSFGPLELSGRIGVEEDETFGSLLFLFTVSEDLRLGAELAADHDEGLHLRTNAGVKWELSENIEIQALVGRTIENEAGPPSTRAKLVFEYEFR